MRSFLKFVIEHRLSREANDDDDERFCRTAAAVDLVFLRRLYKPS